MAAGGHADMHGIPHLVWFHRGERRVVEYGSSFGALRAAGFARSLRDTIVDMNARHLSPDATTLFEAVEDAGLTAAAVNFTAYRGRTTHRALAAGRAAGARAAALLLLQPLRVGPHRRAALRPQPRRRHDRRLRRGGRPLARHARRLRPARLLPLGLRLRLASAPARRRRARRSRAATPRVARAGRRGRRPGRVPRALRRRPLLRPRPDRRARRRPAGGAVRRRRRACS